MDYPSKVLWAEGLTLGPQQLQQQDRYHEARLRKIATAANPNLWGVGVLRWNLDDLANKLLRADAMSLIFQDGEIYEAPGADALPAPVDLAALPAAQTSVTFYAALPLLKPYGGNVAGGAAPAGGTRYALTAADTADLFTDALSVNIAYLHKKAQLLSEAEPRDSYVNFPVVRLRRQSGGGFEIDPDFMPPSLSYDAVAPLQLLFTNLMGKLAAKIEALYLLQRQPNIDVIEVHSGDATAFWMLHTISSASAALGHYARGARQHPERLFVGLLELAGGLMAFSKYYALAQLPAYEHGDPAPAFARLDAIIRDLVDTVISSRCFQIPLAREKDRPAIHRALLDVDKVDQKTTLIFAVCADMPALELVAMVPVRFKVASPEDVEHLITSALAGVSLVHMAQVPSAVPVRPNTYYFSITPKGDLYERMLKAQALTLYAPAGLKDMEVALIGVSA